eukprot:1162063-Pelagomonas_calceolata.AAC.1
MEKETKEHTQNVESGQHTQSVEENWTAQVLDAFQGLRRCDSFAQALRQGTPIPIQAFTDDLRHSLWAAWRDVEGVNPWDTYSKLATYQLHFAVPFDHNVRAPASLPRHVHLDLSQHVMRNMPGPEIYNKTTKINGLTIQQLLFENMGVCQAIHG